MIQTKDLTFNYTVDRSIRFPDVSIDDGQHYLLLGDSGSGKTTLLHLLGGLLRGYRGSLKVDNVELSTLRETELDAFRGKHIGFIFQRNHLISALTVEKNVMMASYLSGSGADKARVSFVLDHLGLGDRHKSPVTEISQGQAQRVAIARAVVHKPSIILADEPTSALDDKSCEKVIQLLLNTAKENSATLVVATHDQRLKDKISHHVLLNA
jgi:ABC-type lipoprotein export system ATPase subunit